MQKITLTITQGACVGPDERPIYGWKKIPAVQVSQHFAIHAGPRGGWLLSHIPSGMLITREPASILQLETLAETLEPMACWDFSKGPESMRAINSPDRLRQVTDTIRAIRGLV